MAYVVMACGRWDQTRTGTLSWAEFQVGCISIKVGCKTAELQLAWHAIDKNRDGALDYGEISAALAADGPAHHKRESAIKAALGRVAQSPVFDSAVLFLSVAYVVVAYAVVAYAVMAYVVMAYVARLRLRPCSSWSCSTTSRP